MLAAPALHPLQTAMSTGLPDETDFMHARSTPAPAHTGNGHDTARGRGPDESLEWFRARLNAPAAWGGFTQPSRTLICRVLGHRDICGPDRGGRTVCAFCRTVLSAAAATRRPGPDVPRLVPDELTGAQLDAQLRGSSSRSISSRATEPGALG